MGFNMSWICVDGIDPDALFAALDLAPTRQLPLDDRYDVGTSHVPLAAATFDTRWCAIFAHYALIMDATVGPDPPRLTQLPAGARCVTCVTLEHAMVSYASLWHGGRHIWQIRHDQSQGSDHLEISGDLPAEFAHLRDDAVRKRRSEEEAIRKSGVQKSWAEEGELKLGPGLGRVRYQVASPGYVLGPADYMFDVPFDVAATITGFRHDRGEGWERFTDLQALEPINGNVLTKLGHPPRWWQTLRSKEYR